MPHINIPLWYKGAMGAKSKCNLEIIDRCDGKVVFVATELEDNPGTSITNAAEEVLEKCLQLRPNVEPEDVCYLERYVNSDSWDLVRFRFDGRRAYDPEWFRITKSDAWSFQKGLTFIPCSGGEPVTEGPLDG